MNKIVISSAAVWIVLLCVSAHSETIDFRDLSAGDQELCATVGYGENLKFPSSVHNRYNFDAVKLRYGHFTSPRNQLGVELGYFRTSRQTDNAGIMATVGWRHLFHVDNGHVVGYDLNFGFIDFRKHIDELGGKLNFASQIGVTYQIAAGPAGAIHLEYRFCHISNANTQKPNVGINTSTLMAGYSWFK